MRPRMLGWQAEGAAPLVHGAPVEKPETVASAIRIGNPARWEEAMGAMAASHGAIRAVSDDEILDAYRFLAAHEGVFCEPASAAGVAGLLKHGAEGARRVACVLTGHGLKDPQTALARAGSRRAVRAGARGRRARRAGLTMRRRLVRVPASSANLGPGFDVLACALGLHVELEVGRDRALRRRHRPARSRATAATSPCGRSSCSRPVDGIEFRIRSNVPLSGGLGTSAAAIVAGLLAADSMYELDADVLALRDGHGGPSGQRRRRAARRVRAVRGRARGAVRRARPGSRRCSSCRTSPSAPRRRGRRSRPRCRWPTRSSTSRTPACSCSASCAATGTSSRAGSTTGCTSRAASTSTRARWSSSAAPGAGRARARRSPARARPCSCGARTRRPGRSSRRLAAECEGWAEVRRVAFEPRGADVVEL